MKKISIIFVLFTLLLAPTHLALATSPLPNPNVFHLDNLFELNYHGWLTYENKALDNSVVTEFKEKFGSNSPFLRIHFEYVGKISTATWFKTQNLPKNEFKNWSFITYSLDGDLNKKRASVSVKENKKTGTLYLVGPNGYLLTFENLTADDYYKKMIKKMAKTLRFFSSVTDFYEM